MTPSLTLNRFARLSSGLAFLLLIAGGMVTSTGSSLAVPDWPLSYGQYLPPMRGGILFEHGHRMIAGAVAILTWTLAFWVWLTEERRWVKRVAAAAALGIVLQAVLGGVTVLYGLPHPVSIVHACLGQTVFCLLLALSEATGWSREPAAGSASACLPGLAALGALYLQLVLGAVLRHTGSALPFHLAGAVLAAGAVAWTVHASFAQAAAPRGPALILAIALPFQLILGLAALAARSHRAIGWLAVLPTAHVACGALLLGSALVWTLRAYRGEPRP